jgi:hypothetical protein
VTFERQKQPALDKPSCAHDAMTPRSSGPSEGEGPTDKFNVPERTKDVPELSRAAN